MSESSGTVYIISDGTGETASAMIRAALVQYAEQSVNIVRCKNVRTESQVDSIVDQAFSQQAIMCHTVVSPSLRKRITEQAAEKNLKSVDLIGPLLNELDDYFGVGEKSLQAGLLRRVNDRYFNRIEAIEYTVKHDDGKMSHDLDLADIILVGISRTSKTPLSIFLSHKGWRVANIPLVLGTPLPKELFEIDQRKVIGLTIDSDSLSRIRRKRLEKYGQDPGGEYASLNHVTAELDYAENLFRKNPRWPVFDVTDRALEETASEIIKTVSSRMGLSDDPLIG